MVSTRLWNPQPVAQLVAGEVAHHIDCVTVEACAGGQRTVELHECRCEPFSFLASIRALRILASFVLLASFDRFDELASLSQRVRQELRVDADGSSNEAPQVH